MGESVDKGVMDSTGKTAIVDSPILRISSLQMRALRAEPERDGPDEKDTRVATPEVKPSNEADVWHMLKKKVKEAEAAGLKSDLAKRLEELLREHVDEFRLTYGQDPPV
jgi:hypothetical protein